MIIIIGDKINTIHSWMFCCFNISEFEFARTENSKTTDQLFINN